MNKEKLYFKVGDKVRTTFGNGEIVFITEDFGIRYLVKIKGFDGLSGHGHGYVNEDGLNDKLWFYDSQLKLLVKEKQV